METTDFKTPLESRVAKALNRRMTKGIAFVLVLFMTVVYLVNSYLKESNIQRPLVPPKATAQSASTTTNIIQPDDSTLGPTKKKKSAYRMPVLQPLAQSQLTDKDKGNDTSHDFAQTAKTIDLPIGPTPESIKRKNNASRKLHEPLSALSQMKSEHVDSTSFSIMESKNEEKKKPEMISNTPLSVYLHYTHNINRYLALQLADRLTAESFVVHKVEHAKFTKNDIRYFHTADHDIAMNLQLRVIDFLKESFPNKSGVNFRVKNLAAVYPQVPRGQLEIWLNLPDN